MTDSGALPADQGAAGEAHSPAVLSLPFALRFFLATDLAALAALSLGNHIHLCSTVYS